MSYWDREVVNVSDLKGKTLVSVKESGDEVVFETDDGVIYKMYHEQDCCESVSIESIDGNLQDLVGIPIVMAEETSDSSGTDNGYDHETWTFYKFATIKGYVTIRWYGSSNGYYSERVDFVKVSK